MMKMRQIVLTACIALASFVAPFVATTDRAHAASTAEDLNKDATNALQTLNRVNPIAQSISSKARAILIFPNVVKAGLVFGGSYGEGVLMQGEERWIITTLLPPHGVSKLVLSLMATLFS